MMPKVKQVKIRNYFVNANDDKFSKLYNKKIEKLDKSDTTSDTPLQKLENLLNHKLDLLERIKSENDTLKQEQNKLSISAVFQVD